MKTVLKRVWAFLMIFVLVLGTIPALAATVTEFSTEPMISAGDNHMLALSSNGTVWAWGSNMVGELGNGTGGTGDWDEFSNFPVQVRNLTNIIAIDAGAGISAALRSDGTVWTWGNNFSGQLGNGISGWWCDDTNQLMDHVSTIPVQVQGLDNVASVSAGSHHMLALRNDGTVWAWGANYGGIIGDGASTGWCDAANEFLYNNRLTPVRVPSLNNVASISAYPGISVAVLSDGTVWRWGRYGRDEDGFSLYENSPVRVSGHSDVTAFAAGGQNLSLRSNGTAWSGLNSPTQVQSLSDVTAIASGGAGTSGGAFSFVSAALRSNGTVWHWHGGGYWDWDESGNDHVFNEMVTAPSQVQGLSNVITVAVGATNMEAMISTYAAALREDGTVWVWGTRAPGSEEWEQPVPMQVPGPNGVGNLNLLGTLTQEPAPSIPNNHSSWARAELLRATELGLIPTSLQGANVDLTLPISREEFAGVIVMTFENLAHTVALPTIVNPFTDTRDTYVLRAFNIGLMVGISETRFDPHTLLNREQAATALTRAFKRATIPSWTFATDENYPLNFIWPAPFADDAYISSWARESVYFMVANGIIQGTGNNMFSPRAVTSAQQAMGYASATREQAIIIALRMVENLG